MPTLSIQTDQNISLDLITAGVGERIIASLIDYFILFLYYFLLGKVGLELDMGKVFDGNVQALNYLLQALVFFVPYIFYDLLFEVFNNGRTPGKMVMKIRVIKINGEAASLSEYFIRWVFRAVDVFGGILLILVISQFTSTDWLLALVSVFIFLPGIPAVIFVATSKSGQRLGDMMAETVLTKVKNSVSLSDTILLKTKKSYKVVYKNALKLSDRDVRLIKETLEYYSNTQDKKYIKKLSSKAQEFLEIEKKEKMSDIKFLRTLMKDYNHLAVEQDGAL